MKKKNAYKPAEFKFCSLDIETSGFDPETEDLLEVGFVFFNLSKEGVVFGEEFSQVFKPKKEVSPKILGLTGITQEELDSAPDFSSYKADLQTKLQDAVIVGHNIAFDIKFLESFGLKFSGSSIDTLDLAQWILPTHPSYNLENLAHLFKIPHLEAHRALADAKAALNLIEHLQKKFFSFPQDLQQQAYSWATQGKFLWADWFAPEGKKTASFLPSALNQKNRQGGKLKLPDKTFAVLPFGKDSAEFLAENLECKQQKYLLGLKDETAIARLWQKGLLEPLLDEKNIFDEKRFENFCLRSNLGSAEIRFILKILVWQHTNWQRYSLQDINLSFSGGQFKTEISGGKARIGSKAILGISHRLLVERNFSEYADRHLVIVGLRDFENALSEPLGSRISWGQFNYLVKSVQNPEMAASRPESDKKLEEVQTAVDLFFGLTNALLQTEPPAFLNIKVDNIFVESEVYKKISQAAQHFSEKLEKFETGLLPDKIFELLSGLKNFFQPTSNMVRWIEISENRCVFAQSPIQISKYAHEVLERFSAVTLADTCFSPEVLGYFKNRFEIQNYASSPVKIGQEADLFSLRVKPRLHILKNVLSGEELKNLITPENLPAGVLFSTQAQVKDFYTKFFGELKSFAKISDQSFSGGNKILRNFSIHKNGLLLATPKFLLQQLSSAGTRVSPKSLYLKSIYILSLPFEQFTHPYQEAVSATFADSFNGYSLPRAIYSLHQVLEFCGYESLEKGVLADPKTQKAYFRPFLEYLSQIFEIIE